MFSKWKKNSTKTSSTSNNTNLASQVAEQQSLSETTLTPTVIQKVNVLIIDSPQNCSHWRQLFTDHNNSNNDNDNSKLSYEIDFATWPDIVSVVSHNEYDRRSKKSKIKCTCVLRSSDSPPQQQQCRRFEVHYVIVRKLVCGMRLTEDYTNTLLAFMYARIPSMNSFHSIYMNMCRPVVHAELSRLRDLHGFDQFPLIDQYMFTDPREVLFTPNPIEPAQREEANESTVTVKASVEEEVVIKVGTAEAGYGKMKLATRGSSIRDFGQTVTRYGEFVTVEPFVAHKELDIRVQMIGRDHIRVYERRSPNWKGNQGTSILKEVPVTDRFRNWAIWCSELFGGMTVLTVDAVGVGDDLYILEINDSASGFARENEKEDRQILFNLCIKDMERLFLPSAPAAPTASTVTATATEAPTTDARSDAESLRMEIGQ